MEEIFKYKTSLFLGKAVLKDIVAFLTLLIAEGKIQNTTISEILNKPN